MKFPGLVLLLLMGLCSACFGITEDPNDLYRTPVGSPVVLTRSGVTHVYGTTLQGGSYYDAVGVRHQCYGVVWDLDLSGPQLYIRYRFEGTDARYPIGRLIADQSQGADYLYGTTSGGGINDSGTAFRIRTDGQNFKVLKYLDKGAPPIIGYTSGVPLAGLTREPLIPANCPRVFYGTTSQGSSGGNGSVYRLVVEDIDGPSPNVTYDRLRNLNSATDGANPECDLVVTYLAQTGYNTRRVIYGTCPNGGANSGGTIWRLESLASASPDTASHNQHLLYSFDSTSGISKPRYGLCLSADPADVDWLYGTATATPTDTLGGVFKIENKYHYTLSPVCTTIRDFSASADSSFSNVSFVDGTSANSMRSIGPSGLLCPVLESSVSWFYLPSFNAVHTGYQGAGGPLGNVGRINLSGNLTPVAMCRNNDKLTMSDPGRYTGFGPRSGLVDGGDGYLYGVFSNGTSTTTLFTTSGNGTVYRMSLSTHAIDPPLWGF